MGTFLGVILGISEIIEAGQLDTNNHFEIIPFLSHIGTAMTASLFGLIFTSYSTNRMFKVALKSADHNKTEFLNTIKYEVLPNLNKGVSDILAQVAKSLTKFNNSFTINIKYFETVFNSANDNVNRQLEFIQRFEKLKIDSVLNNVDGIAQNIIKANNIFENFGQVAEKLEHSAKVYEGLVDKSRSVMEELGVYRDGIHALLSVTETYKENSSSLKEAAYFFNSQHDIFNQVLAKFKTGLDDLIDGYKDDLDSKKIALVEKRDELLRHFDVAMEQLRDDIPAGKLEKLDQLDKMYETIKTLYAEAMQNAEVRSQKLNTEVVSTLKSLDKNINGNLEKLSKKLDKRSYEPQGTHIPLVAPISNSQKVWNKPTKLRWISWMREKFNKNKNK